jgi:hypothetical protein
MSARNLPTDPAFATPGWSPGAHRGIGYLLVAVVAVLIAACQRAPTATEQWTPSYLELNLYAGRAQLQWPGESEWTTLEGKASVTIKDGGRISADATEGAKFFLGDGSMLELSPEATIEVRNPHTLPRLQVVVENGIVQFFGQKPSYEFAVPACPVKLLSVPSLIRIEVDGEVTRLAVDEGAVTCELETKTLTLPTCRQMTIKAGEVPDVTDFCTPSMVVSPPTPTPTPQGFEPSTTSTPSLTPTSTPTIAGPTPTRRGVIPTSTHTPVPPTAKPAQPEPKKTEPPPTQPAPTKPPPTQSPPTEPPTAAPTQPRPTPKPSEPTTEPSKPTPEPPPTPKPPEPTTEAPRPTTEAPRPTTEAPRPTTEAPRPTTEAPKPPPEPQPTTEPS